MRETLQTGARSDFFVAHCCSRPSRCCVECEYFFTNPKKQLTLGFLSCVLRLRMSIIGYKNGENRWHLTFIQLLRLCARQASLISNWIIGPRQGCLFLVSSNRTDQE